MYDQFNRRINYLRISITDRCNLRCRYCMPEEGVKQIPHSEILTFDEICEFTKLAVSKGVDKVRLTGGEPLVRRGVVDLVKMINDIEGIKDLGMTTNGIFLDLYAKDLAKAGLNRVNISLDTMDPEKYSWITRGGSIESVFKGIDAALDAGLTPVKINCVIKESHDEEDAVSVRKFTESKGISIRYIKEMSLEGGKFSIVEGGDGGNCKICNRIRLTANGLVKPCLFNNLGYSVRELGNKEALRLAIENKPKSGTVNTTSNFYNLGG